MLNTKQGIKLHMWYNWNNKKNMCRVKEIEENTPEC